MKEKATFACFLLIGLVLSQFTCLSLVGVKEGQAADATLSGAVTGSTVATVASIEGVRWQQKTFFAQSRYWVFFMNGTSEGIYDVGTACYSSSVDGVTWAAPEIIASDMTESSGENLQVTPASDGYVDVFARSINHTLAIFYKRGFPNSDGTITWLTSWQTAWQISQSNVDFYAIVDSNGYPWISWGYGQRLGSIYVYVTKDAFKNGTWQTSAGFPKQVATNSYTNDFMVPLSSGKVYVTYFTAPGLIYGKLWNGASFGNEETATTSQVIPQYPYAGESWSRSVTVDSLDDIYLLFLSAAQNLVFSERTMSSGWSPETVVETNAANYSSPSLSMPSGQSPRAYWVYNSTSIVFKDFVGGAWDSNPTFIVDEQDSIPTVAGPGDDYDGRLNSFTQTVGPNDCLLWIANTSTPDVYHVKFGLVAFSAPPYLQIAPDRVFEEGHRWAGTLFSETITANRLLSSMGVSNATAYLTYNSSVLALHDVIFDPLWLSTVYSNGTGELEIEAANPENAPSRDVIIANLTFVILPTSPGYYGSIVHLHDAALWNGTAEVTTSPSVDASVKVYLYLTDLNNDGVVDMKDIGLVARAFGSYPGSPGWNPVADVNGDNKIDMKDIGLVARHFGEQIL